MRFLTAVLALAGMIIGAGMFAIPFSFAQTGFWLGAAELCVFSAVVLGLHLLYADIVLATPEYHRMPGYVRRYLGRSAAAVAWCTALLGIAGTLLAYVIVDALFLRMIIPAAPSGAAGIIIGLAIAVGIITFFPLKKEAAINGVLTIFEIAFIVMLPLLVIRHVSVANLAGVHGEHILLPFGVLLFALSGASVIPDVITLLGRNRKKVRAAIIAGSLIPAVLYLFFASAVVGVTGSATSEEAIAGLERTLGGNIAFWASIAGFLAVLTSYVALSANFQAMLRLDMGMPRRLAWLAASVVPVALYFAGFKDFIATIGVVGIFAFGVDGALLFFMGRKVRQQQHIRSSSVLFAGYAILAIILIGVIAELLRIF